jgi:hypothetical protein
VSTGNFLPSDTALYARRRKSSLTLNFGIHSVSPSASKQVQYPWSCSSRGMQIDTAKTYASVAGMDVKLILRNVLTFRDGTCQQQFFIN